jgi:uncharacterized protein with PQ loop repeat
MVMARLHKHKHQKAQKVLAIRKQAMPLLIDRLVYVAAIVEPLFSLPQSYQIYSDKSAVSTSILTWIGFEVMSLIWIWYAIIHKERTILIYQGLFFIIDGSVLIGAIYYGGKLF